MQSCRTAMWCLAILVVFGASTVHGQVFTITCPPTLVSSELLGRITSNTFTLQDFCCLVQNPQILPTDNIVVLVGLSNVINSLNPGTININNPALYANFSQSGYFAALNVLAGSLCTLPANLGGIQIGSNILCLNSILPFCNGPLLIVGPYRVIIYVYRNGTLIAVTDPSAEILLRSPTNFRSIDTSVKNRSAGMIVITALLPILFSLLFVIFTTMLFLKCCCCRIFTPTKCQQES
ncbi:uroplakin-3b-like protein 1 [Ranitomeya variabilis]|uniref:uroplakin-3b-like protein 1 n=1 Tax=Ranitomeya variabilis TaxID=490064 RepID=UPI0040567259